MAIAVCEQPLQLLGNLLQIMITMYKTSVLRTSATLSNEGWLWKVHKGCIWKGKSNTEIKAEAPSPVLQRHIILVTLLDLSKKVLILKTFIIITRRSGQIRAIYKLRRRGKAYMCSKGLLSFFFLWNAYGFKHMPPGYSLKWSYNH